MGARIAGLGTALPSHRVINAVVEERLGVEQGWIEERTGIRERRIAGDGETTSTLGASAARDALRRAGVEPGELDLIICATLTPDVRFPAAACLIGAALGTNAPAFDLNAGCSGFLFALAQADAAVAAGARHVLVVGAETLSRITDGSDAQTAPLFGDGAGAAVVSRSAGTGLGGFSLHSDGARPEMLLVPEETGKIRMRGREVYRAAVAGMAGALGESLARSGLATDDVDLVIAHQANQRILDAVAERAGIDRARVYSNISRYGNTSAASIPLALADAERDGSLRDGSVVALAAFGAGLCWGAGIARWSTAPIALQTAEREVAHA